MVSWLKLPEKKKLHLGLDIGSRYIRGLVLGQEVERVSVESYFIYDLLDSGVESPQIEDHREHLEQIVEGCELSGAQVSLSLPQEQHLSFEFELPPMPEKDLRQVIENKLEESIRDSLKNYTYKFIPVTVGSESGVQHYKAYCAPLAELMGRVNFLKELELNVNFVEPEPLSITALLEFNELTSDESTHLVVDLGESQISTFLVHKNKVLNTNHLSQSLGELQKILGEKMGMNREEAEIEKVNYSFDENYGGNEIVQSLFDDFYCSIFDEIKRLEKLYSLQVGRPKVDSILLTGGGCGCHMLDEAIGSFCQTPTFVVNPFRNIDATAEGIGSEFLEERKHLMATVTGLALRGVA